MAISVFDVLTLSCLNGADLIAGRPGLDNIVESVGMADIFESQYLGIFETQEFLENRLILSSFLPSWPLNKQCACLNFLYRSRASGLVLFFLPPHKRHMDCDFIALADKLNFPVVLMPPGIYSYSDTISSIIQAIHKHPEPLQLSYHARMDLARVPKSRRNADILLEILGESIGISLALLGGHFEILHQKQYGAPSAPPFENFDFFLNLQTTPEDTGVFQDQEGNLTYYSCQRVFLHDSDVKYLLSVSDTAPVSCAQTSWIAEIVSFFFTSWNIHKDGVNSLAAALVKSDRAEAQSLAKSLGIRLENVGILYIYISSRELTDAEMATCFIRIEQYFSRLSLRPIMTKQDRCVIVFLELPSYPLNFKEFTEEFFCDIASYDSSGLLFAHTQPDVMSENYFRLVAETMSYAHKIYPRKKIFSLQELKFVQACVAIVQQEQNKVDRYLNAAKPLLGKQNWDLELWNTLTVHLLDADGKVELTANYLYVHTSTVKYRLKRVSECLGYNLHKMPESYQLYMALALKRLLQ